jgi:hypothetical protein
MKTIQLTAGTNYHAGLRNVKKDETGNYVGASSDYAGAAKAAYAANAEARVTRMLLTLGLATICH